MSVQIYVYFGGHVIQQPNSISYDIPPIAYKRIRRSTTFSELLSLLFQLIGVDNNYFSLKINCKNEYYQRSLLVQQLLLISSDEDLLFFLDADYGLNCLELFVEAIEIERCSDNLHEPVYIPETQTSFYHGICGEGSSYGAGNIHSVTREMTNVTIVISGPSRNVEEEILNEQVHVSDVSDSEADDEGGADLDDFLHADEEPLNDVPIQTTSQPRLHYSVPFFDTYVMSEPAPTEDGGWGGFYDRNEATLAIGLLFKSKEDVQSAVNDYSIRIARREYLVKESNTTLWSVKCKHSQDCRWRVRACFKKNKGMWKITRYGGDHTCYMNELSTSHRNVSRNVIAELLIGQVRVDPQYPIKNVIQEVKERFGYDIPYWQAWHGLKRAVELEYGTWESSVQKLPKFMKALQFHNPGTIVHWKHINTGVPEKKILRYVFWSFRPSIQGYRHCRSVVCVDGTHLYTKYKHKMLIAAAIDANQQIFPLAFSIVDEETLDSWKWFLTLLKRDVLGEGFVCLISDRHPGLISAVRRLNEFQEPNGVHRFCLRHVAANFYSAFKNQQLKDLCSRAGNAHTLQKFNSTMKFIEEISEEAHKWLEDLEAAKWTFVHDGGHRCGSMTTNISEALNGVLKGARRLPATSLVQFTFHRCVAYFRDRSVEAMQLMENNESEWSRYAKRMFDDWNEKSFSHHVRVFSAINGTAQVQTSSVDSRKFVVRVNERSCTCGKWSMYNIPCSHARAALREMRLYAVPLVAPYYSKVSYLQTYQGVFEPLYDESYWEDADFELEHNSTLRSQSGPGRLRTTRIRNEMDRGETRARRRYQQNR